MGYAQTTGYTPSTIQDIMNSLMAGVNTQFGTTYTAETFIGSNFYKYFYALAQTIQANEIKTSEIFLKVQDYFRFTNEEILRPKTSPEGLISAFAEAGYTASVRKMIEADAGKIGICVDLDDAGEDYAEQKLEVCNLIKDYTVGGTVTEGTEDEDITLTNGQLFNYKFYLPDRTEVLLRLTLTLSRNNTGIVLTPEESKEKLLANIASMYSLGKDFEPERYFTVADAPWCGDILLEYSLDDGENWLSDVYEADFDELFEFSLENVSIIEA